MRLEVLSDTALRQLEPARLMALIAHVQRFIDKAVAYQRRLIAVAESERAARAVGDACVADSLVRNTGMSRGAARRAARQAKVIAEQPAVAEALASGDINTDQAEAIAGADVGDEARRVLVAAAVGEGTDATRERAAAAEIAARSETPEQRFMRQHANRFLRFYNNRDGMVCLEGALDPDNGARLKAKVTAIANRMWQKDKKQPPSQRRSPEQRDIDALCAVTSQPRRPRPTGTASRAERSQGPGLPTPDERQSDGKHDGRATAEPQSRGQNMNRSGSRTEGPRGRSAGDTELSDAGRGRAAGGAAQVEAVEASDCATVDAGNEDRDGGGLQRGDADGGGLQRGDADGGGLQRGNPNRGGLQRGNPNRGDQQRGNPNRGDQQRGNPNRGDQQRGNPNRGELQRGNPNRGELQRGNPNRGDLQRGDSDGGDVDDVEWVDYDNEGKRVVPVLRVSTSLDALRDGLHCAGITDSGESLSAATVRRMACDAEIIPTVLNSKGRVIDVGRRTRRVSEALRCVLIARDGGCVWPGCDASPSRCDAHHVKHWAGGGPTNADNLALLCHRHHTLLHEGRHRLKRAGDAWVVLKPDGTRLHTLLAAAGRDLDIRHAGPGAATSSSAPNRNLAGSLDTAPIPALNPGRRPADVAPESNPAQLTLACHDRGEMAIRLTATCQRDSPRTTREHGCANQ